MLKKLTHPRSLIIALLLPLLVLGIGMWSLADRFDNFDKVPAAVVNLDEGATMTVDGKEQTVPLGRSLAGGLTQPDTVQSSDDSTQEDSALGSDAGSGYDWTLTTEEDAKEGLKDGTYSAMVVIPKDFSKNLASIGSTDAVQAQVDVYTNDASGAINSVIGSAISNAAANTIGTQFTEQYLDGLYVGFNDMKENFGKTADGASQLADGASGISTGINGDGTDKNPGLTGATKELADGINGTDDQPGLASGAQELADGITGTPTQAGLASGAQQLADGINGTGDQAGLADGAQQLADGINGTDDQPGLASGAQQLADGINGDGTDSNPGLVGGADQLASGSEQFASGVGTYADGVQSAYDGLANGADGQPGLPEAGHQLADGVGSYTDGVSDYVDGVKQARQTFNGPLSDEQQPPAPQSLDEAIEAVGNYCGTQTNPLPSDPLQCGIAAQTLSGYGQAAEVIFDGDGTEQNPGLIAGGEQLVQGGSQISDGVDKYADGVGQGLDTAFNGDGTSSNPGLIGGAKSLAEGAGGIAQGNREFADQLPQLGSGVTTLADGVTQLGGGAQTLADGVTQLGGGAQTLADGVNQLGTGAQTLAGGVVQLGDGASQLADGTSQLGDGASQLSDGTGDLADGLKEGADQLPSYSESQRDSMSEQGAQPVASFSHRQNEADGSATAIFPFVVSLALWLGAFATFLLLPALSRKLLQSAVPMWRVVLRSLTPGILVAVVQTVVVLATLVAIGVDPVSPLAVGLVALSGAIMFTAFHQTLIAVFGERVGRILSIVLMVLQVVILVGIVPIQSAPQLLQDLSSYVPLSIVSQGLIHASLGGTLTSTTSTLLSILAWFLISVIVTLIFSRGARTVKSSRSGKVRKSTRKEPVAA